MSTRNRTRFLILTTTFSLIIAMGFPIAMTAPRAFADEVTIYEHPAVGLVLLDKLMSGRSREGDVVHFETVANVYDNNNRVLIPGGCLALGRVTRSRGSGMFGKRGQLKFTCEYVILPDGSHVPLTGDKLGGAGTNDLAASVVVTAVVFPVGLWIKGGTLIYDAGTPITMYVADGAQVRPMPDVPLGITGDITLRDKHAAPVVGRITGFDGQVYTVHTELGKRALLATDVSSISLDVPPTPSD